MIKIGRPPTALAAARCNDRDFGTSRWQFRWKDYQLRERPEEGVGVFVAVHESCSGPSLHCRDATRMVAIGP
jgi:hypothetical protein